MTASGLSMQDFLLEDSEPEVRRPTSESLSPLSADIQPTIIGSPEPSRVNLEEAEGIALRNSMIRNPEHRSGTASLSFRGL